MQARTDTRSTRMAPATGRQPGERRDPLLGRLSEHDPIRSITASAERRSDWMGMSTTVSG